MTRKTRNKTILGVSFLAVLAGAGVAYAAEEEPLFCTAEGTDECHFKNGNYWSQCGGALEDGERYLGFVVAQICTTFNEA